VHPDRGSIMGDSRKVIESCPNFSLNHMVDAIFSVSDEDEPPNA